MMSQQSISQGSISRSNNGNSANRYSAIFCFGGGVLVIVGSCIAQRGFMGETLGDEYVLWEYDLFFYKQTLAPMVAAATTVTADVPDCIKGPYGTAFAMGLGGGAAALLGGVPLACFATKLMTSPFRFVRPLLIAGAASLAIVAAIISAATTKCDESPLISKSTPSAGFWVLIAGAVVLFLSALIGVLQASKCPDATFSSQSAAIQYQLGAALHPQGAFASDSPTNIPGNNSNMNAGGVNVVAPYNFSAVQQQQQNQGAAAVGFEMSTQYQPHHPFSPSPPPSGGVYTYGNNNNNVGGGGIYSAPQVDIYNTR